MNGSKITKWVTLKNTDLIRDGILEIGDGYRAKNIEMGKSGLPFARAGNINNGFHLDQADILDETSVAKAGNKISQPGDVVLTSKGTFGRYAFVQADTPKFVYSPQLCYWRVKDSSIIDPRFLFFWMHGSDFWNQAYRVKSLTDMADYVSLKDQRSMSITAPPIATQRKIADILSNYDRLIENNTRRIKILEEMAQLLYREWFVNFRFPGYEQVSMVESELGLIPQGWEASTLAMIAAPGKSIVSGPFGSNIGKRFFVESGVPVIRGNNLTLGTKKFIDSGFVFITEEKAYELRNCEALPGDIIFTAAGTLGQVGVIPANPRYPKYIISNKQLRLRCNLDLVTAEYVYQWLTQPEMRRYIINQNKGSSVPLITLGVLRSIPLLLPEISIQRKFAEFVSTNNCLVEILEKRNENLRKMRDLLLPKLISGEIDVEALDTSNLEVIAA